MPLTKFACPESAPTYGEAHSPQHCILKCKHKCASPFLIAALAKAESENHHKGKYVSATSLGGCKRKLKLEREVGYSDYMRNRLWSYRGSALHVVAEDGIDFKFPDGKSLADRGYVSEWRMLIGFCFTHAGFRVPDSVDAYDESTWEDITCPGCNAKKVPAKKQRWFLLGDTLDGFEPIRFDKETGTLYVHLWDMKTMAPYALKMFITGDKSAKLHPNIKDGYVYQAHVYKYMAEICKPPKELLERGIKQLVVEVGDIQGIDMKEFPRSGNELNPYAFQADYRKPAKEYVIPSIEFREKAWTEKYIAENGEKIYVSLILGLEEPPFIEPADNRKGVHNWVCDYCPFHRTEYCPDPAAEWGALDSGMDKETAFAFALESLNP